MAEARAGLTPRAATAGPAGGRAGRRGRGRKVPVRILEPQDGTPRGVLLDIYGGGFFMGSAGRGDNRNRFLADAAGIATVAVEYRRAPEHPWPAAPDDCETAALWLLDAAEDLFGTRHLAIGGASAGANLAMTTLLRLREPRASPTPSSPPSFLRRVRPQRPDPRGPRDRRTSPSSRPTSTASRTGPTPTSRRSSVTSTTCPRACSWSAPRPPLRGQPGDGGPPRRGRRRGRPARLPRVPAAASPLFPIAMGRAALSPFFFPPPPPPPPLF